MSITIVIRKMTHSITKITSGVFNLSRCSSLAFSCFRVANWAANLRVFALLISHYNKQNRCVQSNSFNYSNTQCKNACRLFPLICRSCFVQSSRSRLLSFALSSALLVSFFNWISSILVLINKKFKLIFTTYQHFQLDTWLFQVWNLFSQIENIGRLDRH